MALDNATLVRKSRVLNSARVDEWIPAAYSCVRVSGHSCWVLYLVAHVVGNFLV